MIVIGKGLVSYLLHYTPTRCVTNLVVNGKMLRGFVDMELVWQGIYRKCRLSGSNDRDVEGNGYLPNFRKVNHN